MGKPYTLNEAWGAENTNPAHQPCPMCGESGDHQCGADHSAGQIIYRIAEINAESPIALQVLMRMIMFRAGHHAPSMESVADSLIAARERDGTMTRMAVYDACKRAARKFPELKRFLNPRRAKHDRINAET